MPISSNEYVDIASVVGGASAVSARNLVLRLITVNDLVPTNSVVSFSDSSSVSSYFGGTTTDEYKQAAQYFSHIDKAGRSPKQIQFARWASNTIGPGNSSAQVFGSEAAQLSVLNSFSSAAFNITLGGVTSNLTGLNLSSSADYAAVAAALQSAIQALGGGLSATTVVYSSTRKGFNFDTNGDADGEISFTEVTSGILDALGWGGEAIFSAGIVQQTLTSLMNTSSELNNNFGSFASINQLTLDESIELAAWNAGQNVLYQYYTRCTKSEASTWMVDLFDYAGCGVTLYDSANAGEYPWLHPAAELASIVWDEPAAIKNFMYTQDSTQTAVVTTTTEKGVYDALGANYFGVTQEAGTNLTFYQNGVLGGGISDPRQMGVYAGEQWFKAELKAQFLSMFLALPIVSADPVGQAIVATYLTSTANQAIFNGVFSVGKQLDTTQKNYITQITGDNSAWQTVQRDGYWFTTNISSSVDQNSVTQYTITYTLIYAKRDGVSKIEGRDILI